MWVNVASLELDSKKIISYLQELYQEFRKPIILSFNSIKLNVISSSIIDEIIDECKKRGIPIIRGPQFYDEITEINGSFINFDELYFYSVGEKIIWFLKNYALPIPTSTVVLIVDSLEIEPIVIKLKKQNLEQEYDYYFMYNTTFVENIENLAIDNSIHFRRIRRKKGDKTDNNYQCDTK